MSGDDGEPAARSVAEGTPGASERDRVADARDLIAQDRERLALAREGEANVHERALIRQGVLQGALLRALVQNRAERAHLRATWTTHATTSHRELAVSEPETDETQGAADPVAAAWRADCRDFLAEHREQLADERESLADEADRLADVRDQLLDIGSVPGERAAARAAAAAARREAGAARAVADRARAQKHGPGLLAAGFAAITHALSAPATVEEAYLEAVHRARQLIAGAVWVSISIREGANARTVRFTNAVAADLDRAQYADNAGPCLHAMASNHLATSAALANDGRWPALAAAAQAKGANSVLSVPVPQRAKSALARGSVNNYAQAPAAFADESVQVGVVLAAHLAALLAKAARAGCQTRHLGRAVRAHDVIEQAKAFQIGRRGLTAQQAYEALRGAVVALNRTLVEPSRRTGPAAPVADRGPHTRKAPLRAPALLPHMDSNHKPAG